MTPGDHLRKLREQGIELTLHENGRDLRFRARVGAITPEIRAEVLARKEELVRHLARAARPIARGPKTSGLRLSAAQRRLWLQNQLHGAPNNLAGAVRLRGRVSVPSLRSALATLFARHEAFHTRYTAGAAGEGVQEILPPAGFEAGLETIANGDLEVVRQRVTKLARQPFELNGVLLHATIFRLGEDDHVLFVNMPHIAADGVSLQIFDRELADLYLGRTLPLPTLRYADYAEWEETQEESPESLAHWENELADAPVVTLPADAPCSDQCAFSASDCTLPLLDPDEAERLKQFGRERGATPFMTLLAAFGLYLWRATGEDDFAIATAINNRPRPELQELVGFFLNIIALRVRPSRATTFGELLDAVRATALGAYEHQELPFERIVERLQPERAQGRNPIARIAFAVGDTPWMPGHTLKLPGIDVSPMEIDRGMLDFDFHCWISDNAAGLTGRLEFRTDLYSRDTASRFLARFKVLLQQLVHGLDRPLHALDAVTPAERTSLLDCWSGSPQSASEFASVTAAFRVIAAKHPDRSAVEFGADRLSYRELDRRSDALARGLIFQGVRPGEIVALLLPRSTSMVVAMLAILKAGGAYLPIDPGTPNERLQFLLGDSGARLLVSDGDQSPGPLPIPVLASADATLWNASDVTPLPDCNGTAYLIYTSGSTGQPKGVRVPHRAICRLVHHTNYIDLCPDDRIAQAANAAFDAATFEVWGALLNGAAIVGIERQVSLSPAAFGAALTERGVTVLFVTTALFNVLAREAPGAVARLRYLLFGGERVDVDIVRSLLRDGKPQSLLHVYGPTENTTFSTYHPVVELHDDAATVPIGKPITGTNAFIFSQDGALVPPGIPGELYLGGDGLADGYLNRPDLTAQAFVTRPLQPGSRLYRTGDIVRFNAHGEIEFIGRRDSQIKLRGFRIELGEIEAALRAQSGVRAAVVVVERTTSSPRIIGYAVSEQSAETLRAALERTLPDYMIPSAIVLLAQLPLNRNGKVETRLLPPAASVEHPTRVPPRDPLEHAVAEIWRQVIGGGPIGAHDHFFDIGGHSLLATQVASRVNALFGIETSVGAVFEHPTVARFTSWLRGQLASGGRVEVTPLRAIPRDQPLALSFAQQRLWFLEQLYPGTSAYNIAGAFRIYGRLDLAALERAITKLVQRHEPLRTRFAAEAGRPVQLITAELPGPIATTDLRALPEAVRETRLAEWLHAEALRPFDLAAGALLRAHLCRLDEDHWVLGLSLHHIIADGWSLAVLRRDLSALYNAAIRGEPSLLPPLPIQYADFAAWQRTQLPAIETHLAYWRRQLAGLEPLRLPLDFPRPAVAGFKGAAHRFTIASETVGALRRLSRRQDATLYMTLLTAFATQLSRYSRQTDFAVGTPIANRQQAALENLIGFFVNTLVMRCRVDPDETFADALRRVRTPILEGYAHQDLPFERLVEDLEPERNPGFNPLIQVIFALQNAPDSRAPFSSIEIGPLEYQVAATRFDLELHLWEQGDELGGILVYNTALFAPETAARFARSFETLLQSIAANAETQVGALRMISPRDEAEALASAPATAYPKTHGIATLFREQAARRAGHPALVLDGRSISYAELDASSDRLARRLAEAGVQIESPVVLLLERSPEAVISMLAVLKAGGCYVPLEPDHPAQRRQQILTELQPALVLDLASYRRLMDAPDAGERAFPKAGPENLAYIIYTSGSTGRPKGSRIPQRAVVRLVKNTNFLPFGEDEVFLLASSLAFDASTLEVWGPLLNGATLAILPPGRAAFAEIGEAIRRHGVTTLWLTAGLFHVMVDERIHDLRGVRHLLAGGDRLSPAHVAKALHALTGLTLINGYGPTENTTFTCCHVMRGDVATDSTVPIGIPISNTWVIIADENLRPVPNGVPGELLAAGDGLARDYLNDPELTAEKFVANPFPSIPGNRLYRTGDLARRTPAGTIEFLGRLDDQLKIRGFRIEPGEIEHLLRSHPGVQDAAVCAHGSMDRKLAAYVIPSPPSTRAEQTALGSEQIGEWETLFDENLYGALGSTGDPTFNIAGWRSSFTGEPIPAGEMQAWLADFVETVRRCQPHRVLEIGCGTGMILFRVAPGCESYTGCDFSQSALNYVRRHLSNDSRVELHRRAAADFSGFRPGQFDTVILNSVVQYFPDDAYLRATIEGALEVVADGGTIILGDVRSLPLLRAFHAAVEFQRAPDGTTVREWRTRVGRALLEEDELAVSPSFFAALDLPRIAGVSVRLQRPDSDNELSKFRYTVIIEVGAARPRPPVEWREVVEPDDVERILREERPATLGLRAVPNARIRWETALADLLESTEDGGLSLAAARRQITSRFLDGPQSGTGVPPVDGASRRKHGRDAHTTTRARCPCHEEPPTRRPDAEMRPADPVYWWQLGERLGYRVEVGWADGSEFGACNVIFARPELAGATVGTPFERGAASLPGTNEPLRGKLARRLGPKLRALCQERLPDYMVPSVFIVLPAFPLTANGKVDYRTLPSPDAAGHPRTAATHVGAQNALEQTILVTWLEVLGTDHVGVNDNFFDVGGHSLLMVQVCSRLKERLRRDVPVMLMFQHPTVRSLAQALAEPAAAVSIRSTALERARRQRESFTQSSPLNRP